VGDFAKAIKEPKACSQDLFAFIEFPTNDEEAGSLPPGWTLEELTPARRRTLESFYRHFSGGLLMDVLYAQPGEREPTVEEFYRRNGMVRRVSTHALLYDGQMKAALWRNESDLGLNLSELLNGFKVFMLDPAGTPWKTLRAAIGQLTGVYGIPKVPVMIYPAAYPGEQGSGRKSSIPCGSWTSSTGAPSSITWSVRYNAANRSWRCSSGHRK
jgi:hypothetical protein